MSVVLCLVLLALTVTQGGALPEAEAPCPRVAFRPVLDGDLDDWARLPQVVMGQAEEWYPAAAEFAEYGGPEDVSAEVRFAWDNHALYLALQVTDDHLIRVRSAGEIDRGGDSLILSVAEGGGGEVNQFVLALLKGRSLVWRAKPEDRAGAAKAIPRTLLPRRGDGETDQIIYELAIPWSEVKPIRPLPGKRLTLVISVVDDDGQGHKGYLERAVSVVLSTAGVTSLGPLIGPPPAPALSPEFPRPDTARFDERCFTFAGRDVLLLAGKVDYTNLPSEAWADRFTLLKAAGLNAVAVAVPWSHYQVTPGEADLSELRGFLTRCQEAGLMALVEVGPYLGDESESGGIPSWVAAIPPGEERWKGERKWLRTVLGVIAEHQLSSGGPVAYVVVSPLPDGDEAGLERLYSLVRSAKIGVPVLTTNAPAARDNTRQPLASLLDTLSLYEPPSTAALIQALHEVVEAENGPAVITSLPGEYGKAAAARRSLDVCRVALGGGATAVTLSEFAPGSKVPVVRGPGDWSSTGITSPEGGLGPGYAEVRLLASFLKQFGPQLARSMPAEGAVYADDPAVQTAARLTNQEGFIFLWDEQGDGSHRVRLTYVEPGSEATVSIPRAGAVYLPPGGAKILPLDVPLGRGMLRYSTSEIAGIHQLGERIMLVVYGDPDTPGEIALKWPGPPLVTGELVDKRWESETKTLILDYYHEESDRYILVDEVEIAILPRTRAAFAAAVGGEGGGALISAGSRVSAASMDSNSLRAVLESPPGAARVTASLPRPPSEVRVDGEAVQAEFSSPERVCSFDITTPSFEGDRRATSIWDRLGRAVLGGPPKLRSQFDRAWFMPDAEAPESSWTAIAGLDTPPETLGLSSCGFGRLRGRFEAEQSAEVAISGGGDVAVVSVNGRFVDELSASGGARRADVTDLLVPEENEIEIVLHVLPRGPGMEGLRAGPRRLPQVAVLGADGKPSPVVWEFASGLGGEAAGWIEADLDVRRWHLLRLGSWREQGRDLAEVWGVGWYRVPFGLAEPEEWEVPYHLRLTLKGTANLYLNGSRLASCRGDGEYVISLPAELLRRGQREENVLVAAVYGSDPQAGLHRLEIAADEGRMTRRRVLEVRF
jgi:hypothetical protein